MTQYNYSMNINQYSHQEHWNSEKSKVETPTTADSDFQLKINARGLTAALTNEHSSFWGNSSLFEESNIEFLKKKLDSDTNKEALNATQTKIQESVQKSDLRIVLVVLNHKNNIIQELEKAICKTIQTPYHITLVLDHQYQKLLFQFDMSYQIGLCLKTEDGYRRKICSLEYYATKSGVKEQMLVLEDQKKEYHVNYEAIESKNKMLKPLCAKIPLETIQDFYNEKYQLMNKSELLNKIERVEDLKGIMYTLTQQNMGSRIIQKLLSKATSEQILEVVKELKPFFPKMAMDKYGNYVLQKIFKVCGSDLCQKCLSSLSKDFNSLLKTKAGTHCLQGILERLDQSSLEKVIKIIANDIMELSQNQYGYHFIEKLLSLYPDYQILCSIIDNFKQMSNNKYSIVIVKALLKAGINNEYLRYRILESCQYALNTIAFDEYGHYIVIEMFKYYNYYEVMNILEHMKLYVKIFAQNQYSSSILHKAIMIFGDYFSINLINQLVVDGLGELMQSNSGCFILHRIEQLTKNQEQKNHLLRGMMKLAPELNSYEKRCKWMKFFSMG